MRIFNSRAEAYSYSAGRLDESQTTIDNPTLTCVSFNDAYRYMDCLSTFPLLQIVARLVTKLDEKNFPNQTKAFGVAAALMIITGYYGGWFVNGDL